MKNFALILLCLFVFPVFSAAQSADSLNWFPYKAGDMWEYRVYQAINLPPDTAQIINIKDSVSADSKVLVTQYRRFINPIVHDPYLDSLRYAVDTSNAQVFQLSRSDPPRNPNVPIYKFNAKQGDKWVLFHYSIGGYEMARVVEVFEGRVFGVNTTLMRMGYYLAQDSTDTSGLGREGRLLAKGFGLIESVPSEGGRHYFLKGAVINGRLYGDTTNVITSVLRDPMSDQPGEFELYQNYPNPFNPRTTLQFQVRSSKVVSINVFDMLGRKVAVLVNEQLMPGRYRVIWDARQTAGGLAGGLPSGVYFYRMQAGNFSVTKKMTLAK
jgi:hypothetical protein